MVFRNTNRKFLNITLTIELDRHSNQSRRNVSNLNFRMVISIKRWGSVNFFIFDENFDVMFSDNCGRKFAGECIHFMVQVQFVGDLPAIGI